MDIIERKDDIVVIADMPGVDEKSVDITLEKNVLTIHGRVAGFSSNPPDRGEDIDIVLHLCLALFYQHISNLSQLIFQVCQDECFSDGRRKTAYY